MSSQETSFYDFDILTQARSRATKQYITDLVTPWIDDPAVVPLGTPDRAAVIENVVAARIDSGILQPSPSELAPYAEWRVDNLLGDFLAERRAGTWASATMKRVERRAYWNYEWPPYINNGKLLSSLAPPVRRGVVEWVGVGFAGKPGVGKTTKMSWLAALIEAVYRDRGDSVSIHYTNKLTEAVESLNHSTVQIIIVDDASLFQHARLSMTRENIAVIQTLDVVRHRFEEKVGYTGVIVTMFAVQRYKGLDLGVRDLTRCFVWSGLTTEEDLAVLSGPSRSFLNQQERAFERHDLGARLYGLVTGLAGEDFLMRADVEIAKDTFNRVSSAFEERQVEAWKEAGRDAERDAFEFLKKNLPACRVYPGGGFKHPDITVVYPDDTKDFVNAKHYDYKGKTGINIEPARCILEVQAAKENHRPSIYIFMVDKESKMRALVEMRLDAKGRYVRRGELSETALVPPSMLANAKARPGSGPTGSTGVRTPLTRDLSKLSEAMDVAIETTRKAVVAGEEQRAIEAMMTAGPILSAIEGDTSPGADAIRKKWRDFGNEKVRRDSFQTRGNV